MKKILIIDDELPLLKILTDEFTKEGFLVDTAENGEDGLRSALGNHPELILLDIKMPVMDGISMIKKLREDKWGSEVPVMVLTNAGDADNITASMNNKILNFYVKADWKLKDIVKDVKVKLSGFERVSEANKNV